MHSKKIHLVIAALAAIMSIRMLGLFMILPVFSVYAETIPGATATLIGLTLGIYGLTQAALQIPLGMLSDRIGRKPVIIAGLSCLLVGSVIAALSHSIYFLMLGRALQGAGAIGSTVLALVADVTRDSFRGKAMAIIGLAIAAAFTMAMIAGPVLNHWFHLSGIFWMTGVLACAGAALLGLVPTPPKPLKIARLSAPTKLWRLNVGIGALHAILTALFIAIPLVLTRTLGLSSETQMIAYFCVLLAAFACALPLISLAERQRQLKMFFIIAVIVVFIVQFGLLFLHRNVYFTVAGLFVFFTAFTFLEANLPSMVSKMAPVTNKGAAMG
ncbi:MAG TPA: MFS transporter, partial [Coxiellaceae bacterium]|nr:MFS transporter [Coxiellaceae bacterium]